MKHRVQYNTRFTPTTATRLNCRVAIVNWIADDCRRISVGNLV